MRSPDAERETVPITCSARPAALSLAWMRARRWRP